MTGRRCVFLAAAGAASALAITLGAPALLALAIALALAAAVALAVLAVVWRQARRGPRYVTMPGKRPVYQLRARPRADASDGGGRIGAGTVRRQVTAGSGDRS